MSINNLRESPIPPQPKGWGLLGQQVEMDIEDRKRNIDAAFGHAFDNMDLMISEATMRLNMLEYW